MCKCSSHKPKLLHTPCTHVITACYAAKGLHWGRYVPRYFFKQTILYTWNRIVEGYLYLGFFTKDPKENALYIPDPNSDMCQGIGRRNKKRIRNNMDEAEAGPLVQLCSKCNNPGHSYKRWTTTSYYPNTSTNDVLQHLQQVQVDVVVVLVAITKECSKHHCCTRPFYSCYHVVIIKPLFPYLLLSCCNN
jgi:hypothetical protein